MKDLKNKKIIYEIVSGSTCYNLNTPESDIDVRGVYLDSQEDFTWNKSEQVSDKKSDIVYYEFSKFIHLLSNGSPEMTELLFTPKEHVRICDPLFQKIIDNKDLFLSQRLFHSFNGYAYAQIKKAKGQGKKWHLEKKFGDSLEPPQIIDYCYYFDEDSGGKPITFNKSMKSASDWGGFKYSVAGMEHTSNIFRLYAKYNTGSIQDTTAFIKNNAIACSTIPKKDEKEDFAGFIIVNYDAFKQDSRDFKQYREWVDNRNINRWQTQLSGEVSFDCKNMLHSFRLLLSAISIFKYGKPIVRWTGADRDFLMNIRQGKYEYDYLIKRCEELNKQLINMDKSILPKKPDHKKIDILMKEIYNIYWTNSKNKTILPDSAR